MSRKTARERFEARVDRNIDDCWHWIGGLFKGYGCMRVEGKWCFVHRLAYEWYIGPIPKWHNINHKCGVRHCVNPEHLYAGTQKENVQDMIRAGRFTNGKDSSDVIKARIQPLLDVGLSYAAIGRELGVTGQYIGRVVNGTNRLDAVTRAKFGVNALRKELYESQKGVCAECQEYVPYEFVHLDHIIPASKGGSDGRENRQILCMACNGLKGTM